MNLCLFKKNHFKKSDYCHYYVHPLGRVMAVEGIEGRMSFCLFCSDERKGNKGVLAVVQMVKIAQFTRGGGGGGGMMLPNGK